MNKPTASAPRFPSIQRSFLKRQKLLPMAALVQGLFMSGNFAHAGTVFNVNDEAQFRSALTTAQGGDQIVIQTGFVLTQSLPAPSTTSGIGITSAGGAIAGGSLVTGVNTTLLMDGANSYVGGTTINSGSTINITADNVLGNAAGDVALNNGGHLRFDSSGGTIATNRSITLTAGGRLDVINGDAVVAGKVSGDGGLTIGGTGNTGQISLANTANDYTGGTTLGRFGKLVVSSDGQLGNGGGLALSANTTFGIQGASFNSNRNVTLSALGNGTTFNLMGPSSSATLGGVISGVGALTKIGAGTLTLTGTNTYQGATNVDGGVLMVSGDANLGGTNFNLTFDAGGMLNAGANNFTSNRSIILFGGGGALSSDNVMNLNGNITGTGHLTTQGTGTVNLRGTNSYTGGTLVSSGVLVGNAAALQGSITNNAIVEFSQSGTGTYAGVMGGFGTLRKTGAGTLTLTGANTYTGGTQFNSGTLLVSSDANLGSAIGTLVFSGGTLANSSAFTLASTRAIHLNSSGGTFDTAADLIVGSAIDGSGGTLTKVGPGQLTLSGANSYTGGTVINGGIVNIASNSNLGGAAGTIQFNGGTLRISGAGFGSNRNITLSGPGTINTSNGNTLLTLNGAINGIGLLVKTGAGRLTLTGNNANTGGIAVLSGTLQGNTDSLKGNIFNSGGVVEFNQVADGSYAGVVSGNGDVDKFGAGTLILKGANTYTGTTHVSAGTLQGDSDSLQGNIDSTATVVFDQAATGTFGGTISNTGKVVKQGAGTLTVSGANTYDGATFVNAGTLNVTGSLAPTSVVIVANGATLGGIGNVGSVSVANGGTLSAGSPGTVGTLTINGDYTPAAGSKLRASFDGTGASLVTVNGAVNGIDNAAVQMRAANGAPAVQGGYTLNKQYTLVSSTGGITGTLPAVDSDLTFLTFTPSFQNANKDLAVTISAIAAAAAPPSGPTPPTSGSTTMLNTAFTQHASNDSQRAAAVALDAQLASLPAQTLLATTSVTPEYALQSASGHQYGVTSQIVQSRLQQLQQTIDHQQQCQDTGGASKAAAGTAEAMAGSECQSVWVEAGGDHFRLQDDDASPGVRSSGDHLAVGTQHNFGGGWRGGLMLGHSNARADFGNSLGDGKVKSTQIGAYAKWSGDGQYVSASLVGGRENYSMHRDVRGSGTRASADYSGTSLGANIEAGMAWGSIGSVSLQPFVGVGVTEVKRDAVRESGAGNLNLNVAGNTDTAVTGQIGIRFSGSLGTATGNWYVQPAWKHSFERASSRVDASFASDGSVAFGYDAAKPKRDALALEAGLQGVLGQGVSWYTAASVQTGNRAEALRLSGGLKASW